MFYEPRNGHGLPHDPFKAIVAPRPIGWISSRSASGDVNLAPYSFFNAIGGNPPLVMFSSEGRKDSFVNVEETGEFVASLATMDLAHAMNTTSAGFERGINEFEPAGLTPSACNLVKPPRIAESPVALECIVTETLALKDRHGEPTGAWMAIGEVVGVHIDEAMLVNGHFDMTKAGTIARCGYRDYTQVTELFSITRPDD